MSNEDVPFLSLVSALSMPELGARREQIYAATIAKLDDYIAAAPSDDKRATALDLRAALAAWTSPEPTEAVAEAAQALLVAEGHGEQRDDMRRGAAWCEVIPWINALAHPESHGSWLQRGAEILPKLDAYLALVADEAKRAAALAVRAALVPWTPPAPSEPVTQAAQAMLDAEDYARVHDQFRGVLGLPPSPG